MQNNQGKKESKMKENILDFISVENIKNQVMKNAYGNDDTFIAKLDPRVLMIWYLFFGLAPWFIHNVPMLMGMFLLVVLTTILAKVALLVLLLFIIGVLSQTGWLLIVTLFLGGDSTAFIPLLILTLKVSTVSLASITVFSGMDPDKLANGLMWFGFPERISFSISYAYRVLPTLIDEFQNVYLSHKLRGLAPDHKSIIGKFKFVIYQLQLLIKCFYPLILNTAKKSRTTVEALEIRGYTYAIQNKTAKKLKLSTIQVTTDDYLFIAASVLWMGITFLLSTIL